jgi:hypothetical protein
MVITTAPQFTQEQCQQVLALLKLQTLYSAYPYSTHQVGIILKSHDKLFSNMAGIPQISSINLSSLGFDFKFSIFSSCYLVPHVSVIPSK